MPEVSVVLPTYNRAEHLRAAVQSVLKQSYGDLELIVVDDASTDRTQAVLGAFQDDRIRYIQHKENRGAAAARNTGIEASEGRYIAFQDSDDVWKSNKLQKQMSRLDESDPVAVYVGAVNHTQKGRVYEPLDIHWKREGDLLGVQLFGSLITIHGLIRRDVVESVGGFDDTLPALEDWDFWIKVAAHGPIGLVDEPLVDLYRPSDKVRNRRSSVSRALEIVRDRNRIEIAQWAERVLPVIEKGEQTRPVVIWGAGIAGQRTLTMIEATDLEVDVIVDSDRSRCGEEFCGKRIRSPEYLQNPSNTDFGCPFVVIKTIFAHEIIPELESRGYEQDTDYRVL